MIFVRNNTGLVTTKQPVAIQSNTIVKPIPDGAGDSPTNAHQRPGPGQSSHNSEKSRGSGVDRRSLNKQHGVVVIRW